MRRETWTLVFPTLILFLMSASHDQWWGGWCQDGRYLVPFVPLAAYVVARAAHHRSIRVLALCLLPVQALITIALWQRPRLLWPRGTGENLLLDLLLGPLSRLQSLLPSLSPPPASPTAEGHGWFIVLIILTLSIGLATEHGRPKRLES